MAASNWSEDYHMLEHAVSTLSAFDLEALKANRAGFEATEFPLLLEDMKAALGALEQTCQQMERASPKASVPTPCRSVPETAHHG